METQDRNAVNWALLVVRVVLGVIFMMHGSQKVFGAFDGPGLAKTVEGMGALGYPVAIGEFFGGLGLALGFLSRFSAASIIVIMIGAVVKVHGKGGFFLSNSGYEYCLALSAMAAVTLIAGPGAYSFRKLIPAKALPYAE